MDRVRQYWQETFGVSSAEFASPGIQVHANSGRVADRSAAWIFLRSGSVLISVPPDLLGFVREAVRDIAPDAVLAPEAIHDLFRDRVKPSYQGYAECAQFRPLPSKQVRSLSGRDHSALQRLREACDPKEWEDSGISLDSETLFGYVSRGNVLAVAGVIPWSSYAANLAVLTHPSWRRQGCGAAAVSAAMGHILDQRNVVLYQTLLQNEGAVRIAA